MEYILLCCLPMLPLLGALVIIRTGSVFSPLHLMFVVMLFGTILKGTYLAGEFSAGRISYLTMQTILPGAVALMVGNFAFVVGYIGAGGRTVRSLGPHMALGRHGILVPMIYWTFVVLTFLLVFTYLQRMGVLQDLARGQLIGRKFFFTDEGVAASLGYLTIGAEFGAVIFAMAIAHTGTRRLERGFYWLILASAVLVFLISSQRLSIVYMLVLVFISLQPKVRTFSLFSRAGGLIAAGTLLVGATILRRLGQTGENLDFGAALQNIFHNMFSRPYFITVDKTGLIVEKVSEKSLYMFGESFVSLIFAPIPRELWPEKPLLRIGPYISEHIYERGGSGIPPGLVGEFYLNFGWPGIVGGMLLLGLLARLAFNRFMRTRKDSADERVFYGIFAVSFLFVAMVADANGGILRFAKLFIAFLICRAYYNRRRARAAAVASAPRRGRVAV